ncbi:helix-turn-helix transcriptional regulator [Aneurinibacillus uraniidurans]|uniref:helix-turn-helix transcriptional regulator n=1 Tax=Aneurinibacillus uraniidurans TaxID=2966586 RepID=UPI00234BA6D8|nr:LuxR C-terminal-related transcriptional regulator [Aneurinibacillus sp. B1]WCN37010.1 LuxR C-terminal-related transcriptional regulator [Aneurinibacillus sp. B1]
MKALPKEDYQKVLAFMDEMTESKQDFRNQTLHAFEKWFGYHQSNFWLCNEQTDPVNPVMRNIDRHAMNQYLASCYHLDITLPRKVSRRLAKRQVLRIHDILSPQAYEQSDYYNDFMLRYGYYHQMVAYLSNGKQMFGSIAFIRSKKEQPFHTRDVMCLEILSRFLSQRLEQYLAAQNESLAPQSEHGLTSREKEVLELVQKGYGNEAIAAQLFISVNTLKKHLQSIYRKFDVTNRTSLCYKIHTDVK